MTVFTIEQMKRLELFFQSEQLQIFTITNTNPYYYHEKPQKTNCIVFNFLSITSNPIWNRVHLHVTYKMSWNVPLRFFCVRLFCNSFFSLFYCSHFSKLVGTLFSYDILKLPVVVCFVIFFQLLSVVVL